MIKCYSLNVRGLRDNQKRREVFEFLKRKQYDVIFIQESHSSKGIEKLWKQEWGGDVSYSHYTSRARGSMTLFKKGTEVKNIYSDRNGRINVDAVGIGSEQYTCINIYAPTNENEKVLFFNELSAVMMNKLNRKKYYLSWRL